MILSKQNKQFKSPLIVFCFTMTGIVFDLILKLVTNVNFVNATFVLKLSNSCL